MTAPAPVGAAIDDAATVPALLAARLAVDPDAPAWWIADGKGWAAVTWRDFDRRVTAVAGDLQRRGIRRGDRVAIMARSCLGWEVADHAILRLGATVVGVDPHASVADRAAILGHARVAACFVDDPARIDELPADMHDRPTLVLPVDAVPEHAAAAPSDGVVRPDDVATLVYTSGTTGAAKAIAFTHRQVMVALAATLEGLGPIFASDRGVCWLPLASLFQRMMNLSSIAVGGQTWFVEDPRTLMEHLPTIRPTILIGVPRLYERIERGVRERIAGGALPHRLLARAALHVAAGGRPRALHWLADRLVLRRVREAFGGRLRFAVSGSAPLPLDVMRFFDGCGLPIMEAYGLSECIMPVACNRIDARRVGSVGRPLRGNQLRIAEDGEVMLRSPGLFTGYLDSAEQARFDAEGFYATGDLGRLDADGYLYLTGRKRDVLKTSGGRQVVPARIEAGLSRIPGVEVAVALLGAQDAILAVLGLERGAAGGDEASIAAAVRDGVAALNAELARHERVRGCVIVTGGLTIAGGHVTSSLKPRRAVIAERYGAALAGLTAAGRDAPTALPLKFVP